MKLLRTQQIPTMTVLLVGLLCWTSGSSRAGAEEPVAMRQGSKLANPLPAQLLFTLGDQAQTELLRVPAGEFLMGAGYWDRTFRRGYPGCELPQHRVKISQDFYLGKYECTVGEFRAFADATGYKTAAELKGTNNWRQSDPEDAKSGIQEKYTRYELTDRHPVVRVTWEDANAYAAWLTEKYAPPGWVFRLPTEAEWEYAARGGTKSNYYGGDKITPAEANFRDSKIDHPLPVGGYPPNPWGFYDLAGNVYEINRDSTRSEFFYSFSPLVDPVCMGPVVFDVCVGGECVRNYREHLEKRPTGIWATHGAASFGPPADPPTGNGLVLPYEWGYIGTPFRGGAYWEVDLWCRPAQHRSDGGHSCQFRWLGFRIALCRAETIQTPILRGDLSLAATLQAKKEFTGQNIPVPAAFRRNPPPQEITLELEGGAWLGKQRFSAEYVRKLRLKVNGAKMRLAWIDAGNGMSKEATPAGFYISENPVSVAAYRAFVKATWYQFGTTGSNIRGIIAEAIAVGIPPTKESQYATWQGQTNPDSSITGLTPADQAAFIQWLNANHAPTGWKYRPATADEGRQAVVKMKSDPGKDESPGFRIVLAPVANQPPTPPEPSAPPAALVMDPKSIRARFLAENLYAVTTSRADPAAALGETAIPVVIADATPENLASLDKNQPAVTKSLEQGKWLVLWGLTPEGLPAFNKLVGLEHKLRPFQREYVEFCQPEDPLLETGSMAGPYKLRLDDIQLHGELINPKAPWRHPADDTFTLVAELPPETKGKAFSFFSVPGLIKYPLGKGGIILCQLNIPEASLDPKSIEPLAITWIKIYDDYTSNRQKREAILGTLLANLGVRFEPPVVIGP